MKNKVLLLLSVCLTAMVSCKKSDDSPASSCKPTILTQANTAGKIIFSSKFTRDASGNLTKLERTDSAGKVILTETWSNFTGNHPGTEVYTGNGNTTHTTTFTWQGDNLVKEVATNSANQAVYTDIYTYDNSGNKLTWVQQSKSNSTSASITNDSTVYSGYTNGRPAKAEFYYRVYPSNNVILSGTYYYTYDANNNCTKTEYLSPNAGSTRYTSNLSTFSNVKYPDFGNSLTNSKDIDTHIRSESKDFSIYNCQNQVSAAHTENSYTNTNIQSNGSGCVTSVDYSYSDYDCSGNLTKTTNTKETFTY